MPARTSSSPQARRLTLPLGLLVLGLGLGLTGAVFAQEGPSSATFAFAPVDGEEWVYTLEDERINDFAGKMPRQEQITHTEVGLRYERNEDGGWTVVHAPREANMVIDGVATDNPALRLTLEHPIRIVLGTDGVATEANGFQELFRAYERALDPASFARLRSATNAQVMANGQVSQWNAPLEHLRGETVEVGETWAVLDFKFMQGSAMPLQGVMEFEGWTELAGVRGMKIRYRYDASGDIAASGSGKATRTISRRPDGLEVVESNAVVEGSILRVIVPESGQLLYEVREETTQVPVGQADGPKAVFLERHTIRYRRAES